MACPIRRTPRPSGWALCAGRATPRIKPGRYVSFRSRVFSIERKTRQPNPPHPAPRMRRACRGFRRHGAAGPPSGTRSDVAPTIGIFVDALVLLARPPDEVAGHAPGDSADQRALARVVRDCRSERGAGGRACQGRFTARLAAREQCQRCDDYQKRLHGCLLGFVRSQRAARALVPAPRGRRVP